MRSRIRSAAVPAAADLDHVPPPDWVLVESRPLFAMLATGTHPKVSYPRAVLARLRECRSLRAPSPFYLTTGRFTFRRR